jgi:hypothetical protein
MGRESRQERRRSGLSTPGRPAPEPDFWSAVQRHETLRRRVERLGLSREEVDRARAEAERLKPTPARLRDLRGHERDGRSDRAAPTPGLATTTPRPLFIRVFVPPRPRSRGVLSANAAPIRNADPTGERAIEDDVRKFAESFLLVGYLPPDGAREVAEEVRHIYAREVDLPRPPDREGEPTPQFRPMVTAVTAVLPRNDQEMKLGVERCERIGSSEIIRRVKQAEMVRTYREWREAFIERPRQELERQGAGLERPEQKDGARSAELAHEKVALADLQHAVRLVDEVESFLKCGILAHGFLRVLCGDCGHDRLVAFSCCPQREAIESSSPDLPCLVDPPRNSLQIVFCPKARR